MNGLWLFFFLLIVPFIPLTYFLVKAQLEFLSLYKKKYKPTHPVLPRDLKNVVHHKPQSILSEIKYLSLNTPSWYWKDYKDEQLNKLAKRVRLIFYFMLLIMIMGIPLHILLTI
jgi:hypothetical protein